ncbi:Armadillo-like helical domain and Armadillo-type fold domain-containing protein [Strongyloides ratti]|uniref:Armadillo-like helical domain and Armadillo-type fold domain-containing protein n=1 Tax=Strongyloides ratti TaxID=34506 RepID=A0A090LI60_STRRB|nr:Armadillo-like helical domain and Armadillo-type fold domain-containing protein [Strongyloides ratti]CEF69432.1 Armadillo-like helical domain and Armadillo-type fold domain-containing protein [Strongyloides ratti]
MNEPNTPNISEAPCTSTSSSACSASSTPSYPPIYVNTKTVNVTNERTSTSYVQNPPAYQYPSVNSPQYYYQGPSIHDYRSHIDRWSCNQMPPRDSGVHSSTSQSEIYSNPSYSHSYLTTTCNSPFDTSSYISGFSNEELSSEHQMTLDNLKSKCSHNTGSQNMSQEKAFEEVLLMLQDVEDCVVFKAAQTIKYIAKEDSSKERQFALGTINNIAIIQTLNNVLIKGNLNPKISQEILSTFFYILSYNDGVSLFLKFLQTFPNDQNILLDTLLLHLQNPQYQRGCHRFSLIILHSLIFCSDPYKTTIIKILREKFAVSKILRNNCIEITRLEEKSLSIMIDILRKLCENNPEQKKIFICNNGIEQLLLILSNYNYENLTNRCLLLLKAIINYDPKLLVNRGVFKIFPSILMSPSSKIRKLALESVRDLGDIQVSTIELEDTLKCLMHVLCTPYIEEARLSIYAIANFLYNNQINKSFFINNDGLGIVKSLLFSTASIPNRESIQRELEEIEERSFVTIRFLCGNHDKANEIQNFLAHDDGMINIFLQHLHHPRPAVLKQLLWILSFLSKNQENIEIFRKDEFIMGLANVLKVSVTTHSKMTHIEDVSVKELISLTLTIICNLIEDHRLRDMFLEILLMSDNCIELENGRMISLPVAVLLIKEDKFKKNILQIMANFSKDERMVGTFTSHPEVIEIIKTIMINETGICNILADSCYRNWISKKQLSTTSMPLPNIKVLFKDDEINKSGYNHSIYKYPGESLISNSQEQSSTLQHHLPFNSKLINYQNFETSHPVLRSSTKELPFNDNVTFMSTSVTHHPSTIFSPNDEIYYGVEDNLYYERNLDPNTTSDSGLGRTFIELENQTLIEGSSGYNSKRQKMNTDYIIPYNYIPQSEIQLSRQFSEVNISPIQSTNLNIDGSSQYNIIPVKNIKNDDMKDKINNKNEEVEKNCEDNLNESKIIGEL